jgi:hypothetical protein
MKDFLKNALFYVSMPILEKLEVFRDKHKGESCYLFGDGASSKYFDLSAFGDRPSLLLNFFPFHSKSEIAKIRFSYGVIPGPYNFSPYPFALYRKPHPIVGRWFRNFFQEKYREVVRSHPNTSFFFNLSDFPSIKGDNIYFLFQTLRNFDFAHECRVAGLHIYAGSFTTAVALAIYMGFEQIDLVGCDYTHSMARMGHWYEVGEGIPCHHPDHERRFLEIAQKYARIRTITREGEGSVLPYINYAELTGRLPAYRENYELTDMKTLKMLDTWPDYNIF